MKHVNGELVLVGTLHVDEIRIAYGGDWVFGAFIEALECIFEPTELTIYTERPY